MNRNDVVRVLAVTTVAYCELTGNVNGRDQSSGVWWESGDIAHETCRSPVPVGAGFSSARPAQYSG